MEQEHQTDDGDDNRLLRQRVRQRLDGAIEYLGRTDLGRLREAGVPATLASDAHAPDDVARDYPTAVAALRGAGYETITRFARREPTQVALRWA